jgi:hypothetical protein
MPRDNWRRSSLRKCVSSDADLDLWFREYNSDRSDQWRSCQDKTPIQTLIDTLLVAKEKLLPDA